MELRQNAVASGTNRLGQAFRGPLSCREDSGHPQAETTKRVAIVGAGLSGLYAARLLEQLGINDYVILEAARSPGGRIISVGLREEEPRPNAGDLPRSGRFDLGAAWYWPSIQPDLAVLVAQLGLASFPQYQEGDTLVERTPHVKPDRIRGYQMSPPAVRIAGGMAMLVDAIRSQLAPGNLLLGHRVLGIDCGREFVTLEMEDSEGQRSSLHAYSVLLALPARLAATTIGFSPPLPKHLLSQWRTTETWMAPHAKYVAVFDEAFWRDEGLSGDARSLVGPLMEVHDASIPGGEAALFGFLGIPGAVRKRLPENEIKMMCRAQLGRLFGSRAETPKGEFLKDWSDDPLTSTEEDLQPSHGHSRPPQFTPATGVWKNRIVGIASEWSRQFPGYVAGAIDAANRGVEEIMSRSPSTISA